MMCTHTHAKANHRCCNAYDVHTHWYMCAMHVVWLCGVVVWLHDCGGMCAWWKWQCWWFIVWMTKCAVMVMVVAHILQQVSAVLRHTKTITALGDIQVSWCAHHSKTMHNILLTYRSVLIWPHIQGGGLCIGGGSCSITSSTVSGNRAVSMLPVHVCLCPEAACSM